VPSKIWGCAIEKTNGRWLAAVPQSNGVMAYAQPPLQRHPFACAPTAQFSDFEYRPIDQTPKSLPSSYPPKPAGRFRKRRGHFARELKNFTCEMKSFRKAPRKLLKSLAHEIYDFGVSCYFKGLRPFLFHAFSTSAFSARTTWKTSSSYQDSPLIARIRFRRKIIAQEAALTPRLLLPAASARQNATRVRTRSFRRYGGGRSASSGLRRAQDDRFREEPAHMRRISARADSRLPGG
jgi:hypothetical protein